MISNQPKILKEANAEVKCRMCGCVFRIRNRLQRRCPYCSAIERWVPIEVWHCIDCGKDFILYPDVPLCEQVPGHMYGFEDLQLKHLTEDDLEDAIEIKET